MTSPMVDTLRNIPLVTEDTCVPMEAENDDSGFPFDREDRDDDFRSQLDDIAKRHPEFAEHLEGFPFRSDSLGRRRPPRPEQSEFRRFDRPFGSSRFERFGFPFSRDPFDEDFDEQVPPPQHQEQSQSQPKQQQQQQHQEEEEKPKAERSSRKPNIQQSNTVDLGQKQEPVNDRNQRSMSAPPPDNRQRFVSSIHIPINRDGGMGDMGKTQSQPQQPQQQQEKPVNKPTERVIPIHVEGRDEPVMPKHTGPSFSTPQAERAYGGQPQPERIFGHRPSQFTQFVSREPPRPQPQQQQAYGYAPQQSQQKFQEVPVQVPKPQQPQQVPPQPQQQQHQEEQQQEQQQQPQKPTPIDIIQSIQRDVSELMGQVEKFTGLPRDKQYLYLDEMLTRNLIKLDNVDTQGQENIRQARKEAIKCIERCIGILEAKAAANVPQEKKPEVEETKPTEEEEEKTEETQEKMEVEAKEEPKQEEEKKEAAAPPAEEKVEEVAAPAPEEKMEVIPEPTPVPVDEAPKEEPKAPISEAENKPQPTDEEMKEIPKEGECKKEDEASKDEKKKGKKKNVKI